MKKIGIIICMILMIYLTGCSIDKLNIYTDKNILIGEEVATVEILDKSGNKIVIDGSQDTNFLYNELIGNFTVFQNDKKISIKSDYVSYDEIEMQINVNYYFKTNYEYVLEIQAKEENLNNIYEGLEYTGNGNINGDNAREIYSKYTYKNEKAFSGFVQSSEETIYYRSKKYPNPALADTDLGQAFARTQHIISLINEINLFGELENFDYDGVTYNIDQYVNRSYKIYENYIIFEQVAPFYIIPVSTNANQASMFYDLNIKNSKQVTQKLYYNINTKEVDYVEISGELITYSYKRNIRFDIDICYHEFREKDYTNKANELKEYVQKKAD